MECGLCFDKGAVKSALLRGQPYPALTPLLRPLPVSLFLLMTTAGYQGGRRERNKKNTYTTAQIPDKTNPEYSNGTSQK
jgi:hypothetical protein